MEDFAAGLDIANSYSSVVSVAKMATVEESFPLSIREKQIAKLEQQFQKQLFEKGHEGNQFLYDTGLVETLLNTLEPEPLISPQLAEETVLFRHLTFKLLCILLTHLTFNKHCNVSLRSQE